VHDAAGVRADPQFQARFNWLPRARHGADMLPTPIRLAEGELPVPARAPTLGEHTEALLKELGLNAEQIAALRSSGAVS